MIVTEDVSTLEISIEKRVIHRRTIMSCKYSTVTGHYKLVHQHGGWSLLIGLTVVSSYYIYITHTQIYIFNLPSSLYLFLLFLQNAWKYLAVVLLYQVASAHMGKSSNCNL